MEKMGVRRPCLSEFIQKIYGFFKKDEREEVEKKIPNEEIVQYYCCYRLCGLIPEPFHYLTKKTRFTNSNFGEYLPISCVSKKDEREEVTK